MFIILNFLNFSLLSRQSPPPLFFFSENPSKGKINIHAFNKKKQKTLLPCNNNLHVSNFMTLRSSFFLGSSQGFFGGREGGGMVKRETRRECDRQGEREGRRGERVGKRAEEMGIIGT